MLISYLQGVKKKEEGEAFNGVVPAKGELTVGR